MNDQTLGDAMPESANALVDSRFIGEFIDEAVIPVGAVVGQGEVIRPRVVASCVDLWRTEGDTPIFLGKYR